MVLLKREKKEQSKLSYFSLTIDMFAAQLEKTRKVEKYIVSLMWEARKMKEENGFIYLRASQL